MKLFNLSLRRKIFISYLILFLVFITLMYPIATRSVKRIVVESMEDRATELIAAIRDAPNDVELIRYLKDQKPQIFFRVGIITNDKKVLYDSHTRRLLGPEFTQEFVVEHPEVIDAFRTGKGYHEEYSEILGQEFAYFAKTFPFHGKTYVMRTAFPYKYVSYVTNNFEIAFFSFATVILLLFSIVTWFIIHRLTRPINQIITAIKPYEEGETTSIPAINIQNFSGHDDFAKLASTLNSLSEKIQDHIDTLTIERNEKSAILNTLGEGVVALDSDLKIIYLNDMAQKLLNHHQRSLIGKSVKDLNQPIYEELVSAAQRENQPMTAEIKMRSEGQRLFLDVIALPTNAPKGAILVLQDKTSHHKMMEMRKNFIANASHELKTPLTIIRGFAEAIYENPELPTEMRSDIANKIVKNTQRMTNLIKDLLILSDVENLPRSRVNPCNLKLLAEECRLRLFNIFPSATVNILEKTEGPFEVLADKELLELALNNLMENAGKYCNGPVTINVSLTRKEDVIIVDVQDNGIGIPKADIENIFQRFYTVDKAHSRKMGGSGLGLSIVETIIEKHGGKISVDSEVGVGTTFTIVLPIQLEHLL
ncbi:MAG: ATP-binding protein [Chlamydiales bacterium]